MLKTTHLLTYRNKQQSVFCNHISNHNQNKPHQYFDMGEEVKKIGRTWECSVWDKSLLSCYKDTERGD